MSQLNPRQRVVIDITQQNFPQAKPALQNYADKAAEDARAWTAKQNFPEEMREAIFAAALAALLRDAIYKLTDGLNLYTGMTSGHVSHFIEAKDGSVTPAYVKPDEGTGQINPWTMANERLPVVNEAFKFSYAGELMSNLRSSKAVLIRYMPPFPLPDLLAEKDLLVSFALALAALCEDGEWRDSTSGGIYENVVAWMPVPPLEGVSSSWQ